MNPTRYIDIEERRQRIIVWLELVGLTESSRIKDDADWAIAFMYGDAYEGGFHAWELDRAVHAWNYAVRANAENDHRVFANINGHDAMDAAIDIAYKLNMMTNLPRHITRYETTPDQFLVDLFISIVRIRDEHRRNQPRVIDAR